MKKSKLLIIALSIFILTGCSSKEKESSSEITTYNTNGFSKITCVRNAVVEDNDTEVSINYEIYYDEDEYIQILNSKEEITSTNKELLDQYETAYKNIYKAYEEIKYYENEIVREDNKLTSTTSINYGKVDMEKIMEIEGEEDNVTVENGKIKLSDWKSFAKKYGTTCSN